ncbi:preprotein translocase subunit SecG [Anaerotalea alkaliphila]|uniref:Protein-export membrane protein SecG n=1 Tax=Anaerotalea alkaliphila TaxID=2662126 RepID=A0A7X5KL04_9FIRM|nr:preprotein translocase subunit SecG [Anaerotalea alkaliphila]NDL66199.1 preprotein translocase subunit SecG [Anaerotalea alkaliphila]
MPVFIGVLKVAYALVCIALVAIVLLQQGRTAGLSGAIGGAAETYWGKNKARSMEGGLHKSTIGLAAAFILLALVISILS